MTLPDSRAPQWPLRLAILGSIAFLAIAIFFLRYDIPARVRAMFGIVAFIGIAIGCSNNMRRIPWRTLAVGFALQVVLALLILQVPLVFQGFQVVGDVIGKFLDYSKQGAIFVFGPLANPGEMDRALGENKGFVFAFVVLPAIIFVSSFFSVLYYLGILQLIVRAMAFVMQRVMRISGPESLSASANVFMGQTEAPLIVKPYVKHMSRSQLLALMIGGMATVSGSMMAIFIGMTKIEAVYFLATSVMAAPASLYIAKLLYPEDDPDAERCMAQALTEKDDDAPANVIDAACRGASDGLSLALNVAAMLVAFIAFIYLINGVLGLMNTSLEAILSRMFSPASALMGVNAQDVPTVGKLLGIKLVGNELLAFSEVSKYHMPGMAAAMDPRSLMLTTFALTGFANFASIGIQIGGIGAMAPKQRGNLASLGMRALLGGFIATMINAAIAAVIL